MIENNPQIYVSNKMCLTDLNQKLYALVQKDERVFNFLQNYTLNDIFFWDSKDPENNFLSLSLWILLGYDPAKFSSSYKTWRSILSQDEFKEALTSLKKYYKNPKDTYSQTVSYTHKNGTTISINYHAIVSKSPSDQSFQVVGTYSEVCDPHKERIRLRNQVEKFQHIIDSTHLATWEWNIQTDEIVVNKHWAGLLGFTKTELNSKQQKIWWGIHPNDLEYAKSVLQDHLDRKTAIYECEIRIQHKDGYWVWIQDRGKVVNWNTNGDPEWIIGSRLEITKTKTVLEQNRLFIEQAPSAIAMLDTQMRYLAVSKRWVEDYHIKDPDIIGKTHYEIFPEIPERWKEDHRRALRGESFKNEEDFFIRKDGSKQWISWELRPWFDNENSIGGLIMQSLDITTRKEIEITAIEKKAYLETILDSIDVGLASCDADGKLTMYNKATRDWYGLPNNEIPVSEWSNHYGLFKSDGITPLKTENIPILRALKKGSFKNYEIYITPKNGEKKLVSTNGSQLIDTHGNVTGAVVALHDITERKKAEDQLKVSEETFRSSFENAAIGMAIVDLQGNWIRTNTAFNDIVGYLPEELENFTFRDITHPDDLKKGLANLKEVIEGKRSFFKMEKRYLHKKGHIVHAILSLSLVRDRYDKPLYFVSQIIDISPRIAAKKKLQETVAKLEGVLEASSQVGIIGTDCDGIITTFNKGAENLLGYTKEEMIDKNSPAIIHLETEVKRRGKELSKKFGRHIEGFETFVTYAKEGMHDTREWTYVKKDGIHFPVQLTVTAVRDANKIIGYLGVATDITKIKDAENRLKSLLAITEGQNKRLHNFAHIVSHNLKSHSGNFEMLLDLFLEENSEDQKQVILNLIRKASVNLSETVMHLNEVVLINTSIKDNLRLIPFKQVVDKVSTGISAIAGAGEVEIINKVPENIQVLGMSAYLESVLLNLLTNGIKYRDKNRNSYVLITAKKSQKKVIVYVQDNGLGIDLKKHRRKVFGMYKTFHNNKDARGIGLFISKNQIEAMEGTIDIKSEVNQGTSFKITLKHEKS